MSYFRYMDTSSTFFWLFTNEHEQVLKKLGSFIEECFLLRGHNWSYRYHWVRWIIVIIHVILNVNWFMVVFDRLWSGRAVTEHKYIFLGVFFFVCLCVSLYVSNHFNHCITLFAHCGTLIGNNKNSYSRKKHTYIDNVEIWPR